MGDQARDASNKFMAINGLVPSTIFDKVNADMDVSEEMEEIRELLYEMIKKNFPMGVSAMHLAEKYHEEFVAKGLGRELPSDWLQQVTAAEEFEAQTRGPITILFVRLQYTSSFKRPPNNAVNVRLIRADKEPSPEELKEAKKRKENEPLEQTKALLNVSPLLKAGSDISVVAFDTYGRFFIRANVDDDVFNSISATLAEYYEQEAVSPLDSRVQIYEIVADGAYALRDPTGTWFRIIAQQPPHEGHVQCFFVDVGVCEKYPVNALRLLPPPTHPVMSIGAMAKEVALGLGDVDEKKTDVINEMLKNILFLKQTVSKDAIKLLPKTFQLAKLIALKSKCEVDLLDENEMSVVEKLQSRLGIKSTKEKVMHKVQPVSVQPPVSCCFDQPFMIEAMSVLQMPTTVFPANALFAAGPTDISLRQLSLDPMPDYMYEKLKEECAIADAQLIGLPQPGSFYAALIDDRWERVQCLRPSKIDKMSFCVYLIDVGAFHYVRREVMRRLNSTSPFKKMLMFKCKVGGIRPSGGKDFWSRESHEAVREFFEAACNEPVVVELMSNWTHWKQLNAPAVPLCEVRLSCCGRDLAEWLIACGLALSNLDENHPFAGNPTFD